MIKIKMVGSGHICGHSLPPIKRARKKPIVIGFREMVEDFEVPGGEDGT